MSDAKRWETEAALVADFVAFAAHYGWVSYAETCGWDLIVVRPEDGFQIGVEAKLSLNAKVLCQVLDHDRTSGEGPDCHAILVPRPKLVNGLDYIAGRLGITVISGDEPKNWSRYKGPSFFPDLPRLNDSTWDWREDWPQRCPDRRCKLPDYVPDVTGGKAAPLRLTEWKIAAIKAQIILETRGRLTRHDFKMLRINASRWTQFWLKSDGNGGWVDDGNMPDLKAQHPVNYEQIRADAAKWMPPAAPTQQLLAMSR